VNRFDALLEVLTLSVLLVVAVESSTSKVLRVGGEVVEEGEGAGEPGGSTGDGRGGRGDGRGGGRG
jgi:hypothetical protein